MTNYVTFDTKTRKKLDDFFLERQKILIKPYNEIKSSSVEAQISGWNFFKLKTVNLTP